MEDGLKVILSADVSQFQQAFAKAVQSTKQSVGEINQTLASTGKEAEAAAKSWKQFVGERMGQYMKEFGSHGAAIRKISEEWKVYKNSLAGAAAAGKGIEGTGAAVAKVASEMQKLGGVKVPTTDKLAEGIQKAELALRRFSEGGNYVRALDGAIGLLNKSKNSLSDTAPINTLLRSLGQLKAAKAELNSTGIRPAVDVSDAARAIEQIKQAIATQNFKFSVTADSRGLESAMVRSQQGTKAAVDAIKAQLASINTAFNGVSITSLPSTDALIVGLRKAENALKQFSAGKVYVKDLDNAIALLAKGKAGLGDTKEIEKLLQSLRTLASVKGQINSEKVKPVADVSEALKSIDRIKQLVAGQEFKFSVSADNRPLLNALLQAQRGTSDTVGAIQGRLGGLSSTFAGIAASTKKSLSEVVASFNALSGAPATIITRVAKPDVTPVQEAVKRIKAEIGSAFKTTLPSTDNLVTGLNKAEAAVKRFGEGKAYVRELDRAIKLLNANKVSFGDTAQIDTLVAALQRLRAAKENINTVNVKPIADVGETARSIERIKQIIARQDYKITLSVNDVALQDGMVRSQGATATAVEAIKTRLAGLKGAFENAATDARTSLTDIVNNFNRLSRAPFTLTPQVQPPNIAPVLEAVRKVRANLSSETITLPPIQLAVQETGVQRGIKSIQQLQDQIKRFEVAMRQATNPESIARLNRAIDAANTRVNNLKNIKDPFQQLNRSGNQASNVLIDLSRIAQDAPYGFIGIANNINPLVESFGRLKGSTGGLKGALAAVGSALAGPGGIALGVGLVSSLLVTFGDRIFKARQGANLFKEAIAEAAKNVGEQVVKLEIFKSKLNDLNLSSEERIKWAKEYNKVAEETNKIDLKQIDNLTQINQKIDAQNNLILRRALSAAAMSKLTEASNKLIENELKFQAELDKRGLKEEDVVKMGQARVKASEAEKKAREGVNGTVQRGLDGVKNYSTEAARAAGVTEDAILQLFNSIQQGRADLQKEASKLSGFITIDGLTTKDPKGNKAKKAKFEFLDEFLDFDPSSVKLTAEQKSKLVDVIHKFSDQFGEVLEGADFRKQGSSEAQMIEFARKWWDDFQNGIVKLKPPKLTIDFLKDVPVEATSQTGTGQWVEEYKKSLQQQLDKELGEPIPITAEGIRLIAKQEDVNKQIDAFEKVGEEIGNKINTGFGKQFGEDFKKSLDVAIKKGLSGKTLEDFKAGLTVVANIGASAINGVAFN